jgi:CD2 antigen cytoplasmic tail-binding protein 2
MCTYATFTGGWTQTHTDVEEEEESGRLGDGWALDSDDEDEEQTAVQKSKYQDGDEDWSTDLDTTFNDGGVRVTGFNLDEEKEEGHFDEAGMYHEKQDDEHAEADAWLVGQSMYVPKEKEIAKKTESKEEAVQRPRHQVLKEMVALMKAGETVTAAIRRLGGGRLGRNESGKSRSSRARRRIQARQRISPGARVPKRRTRRRRRWR